MFLPFDLTQILSDEPTCLVRISRFFLYRLTLKLIIFHNPISQRESRDSSFHCAIASDPHRRVSLPLHVSLTSRPGDLIVHQLVLNVPLHPLHGGDNPPSVPANQPFYFPSVVYAGSKQLSSVAFRPAASAAVIMAPISSDPEISTRSTLRPPVRPRFHHQYTNDRIREGSGRPPTFSMISKIKKDRKSIFKELGLDTDEPSPRYTDENEFGYITGLSSPASATRTSRRVFQSDSDGDGDDGRSETEKPRADERERESESESRRPPTPHSSSNKPWYTKLAPGRRPRIKTVASAPPSTMSSRLSTTALLIAVVLPAFSYYNGRQQVSLNGADAGVMRSTGSPIPVLETRADSPTDMCARWAHQGWF